MYEYKLNKIGDCYVVDYLDIFFQNTSRSENRYTYMESVAKKILVEIKENERKKKERQEELKLKYINIDPYGEENWED